MDDCFPDWLLRIQLFRGRLSHKSVKMNATLSKVIVGNDGFAVD